MTDFELLSIMLMIFAIIIPLIIRLIDNQKK